MTKFQEHCKKKRVGILDNAFEEFKRFYPELSEKEQKKEYNKQMGELFFNQSR